jgi:hypothetical protein
MIYIKKQIALQSKLNVPFTNLHDVTRCIEEFVKSLMNVYYLMLMIQKFPGWPEKENM